MAIILFVLLGLQILMLLLELAGAQSIGVCYGRNGNNLPSARDVINLYNANGIRRMRIYDPNPDVLNALRGTNIEVTLDVPNLDLQSLASNPSAATTWVQNNVRNYSPSVRFRYITVGNEVDPNNGNAKYVNFVLPAMQNIYNAIVAAGLIEDSDEDSNDEDESSNDQAKDKYVFNLTNAMKSYKEATSIHSNDP